MIRTRLATTVLAIPLLVASTLALGAASPKPATAAPAQSTAARPPGCQSDLPPAPPPLTPTTISTVGEAYYCILDHYVAGDTLDHRTLLAGAFAGFTQELHRRGVDRSAATMPALTGDRDRDWTAVSGVYQQVLGELPDDAALRQSLAEATIRGMVASLHDNHARFGREGPIPGAQPGQMYGIGLVTSPAPGMEVDAPQEITAPLFISAILGGPAAKRGLRPGDIIVSVNGSEPFANGQPSPGVIAWLLPRYPQKDPVRVKVRRPSTGRTWTVDLTPTLYTVDPAAFEGVVSTRLAGGIAHIKMRAFMDGAADTVLRAVADLGKDDPLRGIVLDLRGNGGGSPTEVSRLLGAFVHGKAWSFSCDTDNVCTPNKVDDSVDLLHLPLVVLTDRDCASACDAFSGAVRDLNLGPIVGTRTSGLVSGPSVAYLLSDGSLMGLPSRHEVSANGELINGIGVAPDYYVPRTAEDLSAGRDPGLAKALTLIHD